MRERREAPRFRPAASQASAGTAGRAAPGARAGLMEDPAAAKLRASLKRIKGKLMDVNQLIAQFSQVKQEKLALQAESAGVQEEVATLRQEKQAFQKRLSALQTALEAQTAGAAMQQRLDAADALNRRQAADLASVQRQNKDLEAAAKKLRLAERERVVGAPATSATGTDDAAAQRLAALQAELQSMKSAKLQAPRPLPRLPTRPPPRPPPNHPPNHPPRPPPRPPPHRTPHWTPHRTPHRTPQAAGGGGDRAALVAGRPAGGRL